MFKRNSNNNDNVDDQWAREAYNLKEISNNPIKSARYLYEKTKSLTGKSYSYNPAIGREEELQEMKVSLGMPEQSVLLVGPSGTGKSAIVEGLAYEINTNKIKRSSFLRGATILELPMYEIVAGTELRGMLEAKIKILINGLKYLNENLNAPTILFIDEIHTLIGMGKNSVEGGMDISNALKSPLARGEIKLIGATTNEEFNKYIDPQKAFKRRFEIVNIKEPDLDTLTKIINGVIPYLENNYSVKFPTREERDKLISFLITSCYPQYRNSLFFENNPDLLLRILKRSFSLAREENLSKINENVLLQILSSSPYIDESYKSECKEAILSRKKQEQTSSNKRIIC